MKNVIYLGSEEGYMAASRILYGTAHVIHVAAVPDAVSDALKTANALLDASMKVVITDEMLRAAHKLRIISCATTGSDHIARTVASERGIQICTLKEDTEILRNITPAAELSWALLLACARKLPAAFRHVKAGQWIREEFPGVMLNGRRLGLVGCGRIGGWMARYAHAFGMDVIGYDPYLVDWPNITRCSCLEEVFATSDFVSVHVHLNQETRGLISRSLFERMKPGAIFINTSRGAIIDEAALLDHLRSGHLGGAGIDVLSGEPDIAEHPLVQYAKEHDNLIITPHCGGFSPDAVHLVCALAASKIRVTLEKTESCS